MCSVIAKISNKAANLCARQLAATLFARTTHEVRLHCIYAITTTLNHLLTTPDSKELHLLILHLKRLHYVTAIPILPLVNHFAEPDNSSTKLWMTTASRAISTI